MKTVNAFAVLAFLAAQGCKKDEDKTTSLPEGSFAGQTYYLVETGDLEGSESLLKGSGALVFKSSLNEIESADNFALEFTVNEGGSLALVTHSDGSLAGGLTVQWERAGSELIASLKADGSGTDDHSLSGIDAEGSVSLSVDVHNGETPAHVLIWNAAAGSFGEDDALFNSEEDGAAPGAGKGRLWGLVLRNAEVKAASRGEAKFSD